MSDVMSGLLAGWFSAPLIGCVGWCVYELIKLGVEDRREKKEERLKNLIRAVAKEITPKG